MIKLFYTNELSIIEIILLLNNYLTIDEKIFYNFNENIENVIFSIKFEMTDIKVIRLFYNKRNNNRLILKHFGN